MADAPARPSEKVFDPHRVEDMGRDFTVWLAESWKILLGVLGGALLLFGGIQLWEGHQASVELDASAELSDAYQALPDAAPIGGGLFSDSAPGGGGSLDEAASAFAAVASGNQGTQQAEIAQLELGNVRAEQGNCADARGAYAGVAASEDPTRSILALSAIASCFATEGDTAQAVASYEQARSASHGQVREFLSLELGRAYEAAEDSTAAVQLYQSFLLDYPDSSNKLDVEARLSALQTPEGS